MNVRSSLPPIATLLALILPACLPPSDADIAKAEAEKERARRASATPTPPPKPGAWMERKQTDPLGTKNKALKMQEDPLNQKARK